MIPNGSVDTRKSQFPGKGLDLDNVEFGPDVPVVLEVGAKWISEEGTEFQIVEKSKRQGSNGPTIIISRSI